MASKEKIIECRKPKKEKLNNKYAAAQRATLAGLVSKSAMINVDGLNLDIDESKMQDTFVIGAGFARTGTSSMQIALAKLGWRSYHMREIFKNGSKAFKSMAKVGTLKCKLKEQAEDYDPSFSNFDQIVLSPEAFDWNELFNNPDVGKYNAVLDFPLCVFYLDLMAFYKQNYKVVLTVRDDAEQWFQSADRTIHRLEVLYSTVAMRFLYWIDDTDFNLMRHVTMGHLVFDQRRGDYLYNFWKDKKQCIQRYNDWIDGVKKHVPKDKLLIFNVKEGYTPLCKFLDVEGPDEPFPRSNATANMQKDIEMVEGIVFKFNCVVTGLVVGAAVSGYCLFTKYLVKK